MKEICDKIILKTFSKLDHWLESNNSDHVLKLVGTLESLLRIRSQIEEIELKEDQINVE